MTYDIAATERRILEALAMDDAEAVAGLGRFLDRLDVPRRPASAVGAGLWYANRGLWVFPLAVGSKKPYRGSQGLLEATNDPASVVGSFGEHPPDSNIGIATGHGVDVIDVDGPVGMIPYARSGWLGPDGEWLSRYPVLGTVSTPSPGGKHIYVPADPGQGNRASMLDHIDYRGDGGYVVAPPSVTPQGKYVWTRPLDL